MATYIQNVEKFIQTQVIPNLLKDLAQKVKTLIHVNIRQNTNISTDTLQNYVTFNSNDYESIIYIDFEKMSEIESRSPSFADMGFVGKSRNGHVQPRGLIEWGRFTNTYRGSKGKIGDTKWGNQLITFKLAEWLEKGGVGNVGNQPIKANNWFTITVQQVNTNLDHWIKSFFDKYGFEINRRR